MVNEFNLTPKEEKFCQEYILHLNQAKAARNAGYAANSSHVTGCQLLMKANIKERINYLKKNLAEATGISIIKILKEHEKIAFSSIAHLHNNWIELKDFKKLTEDQKSCIKSISTKIIKNNKGREIEFVKIELYDKQKSLDSIKTMLGFDAPVRTEITGKDGEKLEINFPKEHVIIIEDYTNNNEN